MTTTTADITAQVADGSAPVDVVAGVDTHKDTHHVAVLAAATGARLGDLKVPATPAGYERLLGFVGSFGTVRLIGVEGTNSYGAGLARFLTGSEERVKLAVDDAHATFTHSKVEGLIRRAGLRYPNADLRRVDMVEQRGLDRGVIAQLGTCQFITRQQNVVFQGFTGSGKSYLGSALAKQVCQYRYRAHYIRVPDLEETWAAARDKPGGEEKWLRKYAAFHTPRDRRMAARQPR
ncbi:hypothetical protein BKA10_002587 [Microbacterium invictum]|uniref:IstB-like ATP-binding domain-containing protein n=1 Tax=Microbacterium invictum TaxID=515415 RepID=A0AA40VNU5_9MICO|nr:ATP-binding protein [Microbacterium invictum]MBB4140793.1 hypothetical protein [Microbacterium invictum]